MPTPLLARAATRALFVLAIAAAPARADTAGTLMAEHPRLAVLPAPYFATEPSNESYADLEVHPYAFVPAGRPWAVTVKTGQHLRRFPQTGASTARKLACFWSLGDRPIDRATVTIRYQSPNGLWREAAEVAPAMRPQRFSAQYQRGPFAHQLSTDWGEDGAWLVVIQERYKPRFWRSPRPVLYVGGDFLYQHVEGVVRYLRTHGVNALGYKPDYDRPLTLDAMAETDYPMLGRWVKTAGRADAASVVGVCVGGLHARGLAQADRRTRAPWIADVAMIGAPNQGSHLADVYNSQPLWPWLHRFFTQDPDLHEYKDARSTIAAFNTAVPPTVGVTYRNVVLDPTPETPDPRYDQTVWLLRALTAQETGKRAQDVHTDGLLTPEEQAFGEPWAVWRTDHAGMINDGRGGTYFDAYDAHLRLVEALGAEKD